MASKFNARNPSVKRIQQEIREFSRDPSPDMMAEALEENIFEWHFVVKGAADSEFEGGLYHGRILLPAEYPFKPPAFLMLTPNGRFETGQKVCLSISSHHPEHWQPSWSVRTALVALVAFMQTPGGGAIASLDYSKDDRRELARLSRLAPPTFGSQTRQEITNAAHATMLEREAGLQGGPATADGQIAPQLEHPQQTEAASAPGQAAPADSAAAAAAHRCPTAASSPAVSLRQIMPAERAAVLSTDGGSGPRTSDRCDDVSQQSDTSAGTSNATLVGEIHAAPRDTTNPVSHGVQPGSSPVDMSAAAQGEGLDALPSELQEKTQRAQQAARGYSSDASLQGGPAGRTAEDACLTIRQGSRSWEEAGLTAAAFAIVVLIAALLVKKVVVTTGAASYQAGSFL